MPFEVVVVGENPSLGENLAEFLAAHDFKVALVGDVAEAEALRAQGRISRNAVLVDACSWQKCAAQRRWRAGTLREHPMMLIGPRRISEAASDRFYHVTLPLVTSDMLRLLRRLLGTEAGTSAP